MKRLVLLLVLLMLSGCMKTSQATGTYVWDLDALSSKQVEVQTFLESEGILELYLYIDLNRSFEEYEKLLEDLVNSGVKVYALMGDPSWVVDLGIADEYIAWYESFQMSSPYVFSGIHLDVEYYLTEQKNGETRFIKVLNRFQGVDHLQVVIPFWLDEVPSDEGTLLLSVLDLTDELFVMAYRNSFEAIEPLVETEWIESEKRDIPLTIVLETCESNEGEHISFYDAKDQLDEVTLSIEKKYRKSPIYKGYAIHHVFSWMDLID